MQLLDVRCFVLNIYDVHGIPLNAIIKHLQDNSYLRYSSRLYQQLPNSFQLAYKIYKECSALWISPSL